MRSRLWIIIGLFATVVAQAGDAPTLRPEIGTTLADLRFKDIRYLSRSLKDLGDHRATVFVFCNTTCPLVQKYWPKLKRLDDEYRSQEVQFVAVNVSEADTIPAMAEQALEYGFSFPIVKDVDGSVAAALGAERTPEAVVLDADRRIRYRGRIDDQYRIGGTQTAATTDELRQAIEAVLANREPAVTTTPVDGCKLTPPAMAESSRTITWATDVAPLLDRHCVECHRTNGGAPFSLASFEDASAHAEMIAETVAEQRMPPWYASRRQHFDNERGLSPKERDTIVAWSKLRTRGDDATRPPSPTFPDGEWEIGQPDLVTTALTQEVLPAEGFVDYRYTILPHIFLKETWITAAEIKPSNPAVVHHCNLGWMSLGEEFSDKNFITGRVPGGTAMNLEEGVAYRIPANSVVGLQIHYTTTGKPETNRMSLGLNFPKGIIHKELHHLQVATSRFAIPPGAAAHPVTAVRTLKESASGIGMFAHMHLRGKDMTFRAIEPDGRVETLLSIPNYHYDWQQNYRWKPGTKTFPTGTKIEVTAHFDNSPFNPFNPDSSKTVRFGQQTVDEMMYGFFFYTDRDQDLNLQVDPRTGHALPK